MSSSEEATLAEILSQQAGLTSEIELKVIRNDLITYGGNTHGKEWTSSKVQVVLQSKIAEQYCLGVAKLKKNDKAELKKVEARFKIDSIWKFKAIKLVNDKPAYVHTSVRITIDLRESQVSAMLQSTSFPEAPVPQNSIIQILQLKQMQRFDLMAIPAKIMDERTSASGMRIIDVRLVDGSEKEGSTASEHEYACLPLTLFFQNEHQCNSFKAHVGRTPMLFMGLAGSRREGKVQVSTVKEQFWWRAAAGPKCESMAKRAAEICDDEAGHADVATLPEFIPAEAVDYTEVPATLSVCRQLDPTSMSESQLLGDETEHVYQLNHVHVLLPNKTDRIKTSDDRLFAQLDCWDISKKISIAFRKKAMLNLAAIDEQSEYEQLLAQDELRHAMLCSLRVRVKRRNQIGQHIFDAEQSSQLSVPSQDDAAQQSSELQCIVVEATPVMHYEEIPEDAVEAVVGVLAGCPQHSERLAVVPLDKLKPSPFYNMVANDEPADKALALLRFTRPSNGKQLSHGFRVVSERVQDATATEHGSTATATEYSTISICSVEKVTDFSPAKSTTCLAVISKMNAPAQPHQHAADLYIEAMEALQKTDVDAAVQMMRQLQKMGCAQFGDSTSSTTAAWTQRKCRRLNRYPSKIETDI